MPSLVQIGSCLWPVEHKHTWIRLIHWNYFDANFRHDDDVMDHDGHDIFWWLFIELSNATCAVLIGHFVRELFNIMCFRSIWPCDLDLGQTSTKINWYLSIIVRGIGTEFGSDWLMRVARGVHTSINWTYMMKILFRHDDDVMDHDGHNIFWCSFFVLSNLTILVLIRHMVCELYCIMCIHHICPGWPWPSTKLKKPEMKIFLGRSSVCMHCAIVIGS